jgi:transposase
MSKSKPNKKELARNLGDLAKEGCELVNGFEGPENGHLAAASDEIIHGGVTFLRIGLSNVSGILPSERPKFEFAVWVLSVIPLLMRIARFLPGFVLVAAAAANRLFPLDSTNSDKPSGKDIGPHPRPNRRKKPGEEPRKPGGQKGHEGKTLQQVENPDKRIRRYVDRSKLPPGDWRADGFIIRQVVEFEVKPVIIQYEYEVMVNDATGERINTEVSRDVAAVVVPVPAPAPAKGDVAEDASAETPEMASDPATGGEPAPQPCDGMRLVIDDGLDAGSAIDVSLEPPLTLSHRKVMAMPDKGVSAPVQYGKSVGALTTYLNVSQLIPFLRVNEVASGLLGLNVSAGTVFNFRREAVERLESLGFPGWAKNAAINASVINVDETGINIAGKGHWYHVYSTDDAVWGESHPKRGHEAMDDIEILPCTGAVIVRDCLSSYFKYDQTLHAFCNAHLLRELKSLTDKFRLAWPGKMDALLRGLNVEVAEAGGVLGDARQAEIREAYRDALDAAAKETPPEPRPPGKKGRHRKSDARNLLERLEKYEDEYLRFMTMKEVPFTNNRAERDLRMLKVHDKISGSFRSQGGAADFAMIRSYLLTCARHGINPYDALRLLYEGKRPEFMSPSKAGGGSAPAAPVAA